MFCYVKSLEELYNWPIFVVTKESEISLTQLYIKLIINMCGVYLSRSDFFIREFIVAAEAKLDHSYKLTLLFER